MKYNSGLGPVPNTPGGAQAASEPVLQISNVHHLLELGCPPHSRFLNPGATPSPNGLAREKHEQILVVNVDSSGHCGSL